MTQIYKILFEVFIVNGLKFRIETRRGLWRVFVN